MSQYPRYWQSLGLLPVCLLSTCLVAHGRRVERRRTATFKQGNLTQNLTVDARMHQSLIDVGFGTPPPALPPNEKEIEKFKEKHFAHYSKELEEEKKKHDAYGYFEPLPVPWTYYVTLFFCFLFLVGVTFSHRCVPIKKRDVELASVKSEFIEFRRPRPSSDPPEGGFFDPAYVPMAPKAAMQMWFIYSRWSIWTSVARSVPRRSFKYALQVSGATAILWILGYLCIQKKVFKEEYVTFNGPGQWSIKDDNWCRLLSQGVGNVSTVVKFLLAFFLMWAIRVRIIWLEGIKTRIWNVQKSVELVSFIASAFLSGDDLQRAKARHDIHRWLTAAHFWHCKGISEHLGQFDEQDLYLQGVLSKNEADIIAQEVAVETQRIQQQSEVPAETGQHESASHSGLSQGPSGRGGIEKEKTLKNPQSGMNVPLHISRQVRDILLWWIQIRIQASVKEKLMDKDKLKKVLGALWRTRNDMHDISMDVENRQMYLVIVMMQVFVDIYVATSPLATLGAMFHGHIWTMPFPVLETFMVAFLYDLLLEIYIALDNPFGIDIDDLHLDPILVLTERITFFNLGRSEMEDLPLPLAKGCEKKDKEDKDKGEQKDKEDKSGTEGDASKAEKKEKKDKAEIV